VTPTLIAAIAAGIGVIVSAVFTGLAQLQHNRSQHGDGGQSQAGGQSSQGPPLDGSR
jgi:hypothetical protein